MGDMLIRGIDSELKRRLEESARLNKRSLSEEAVVLIQKGFSIQHASTEKAGDRLYSLVGNSNFTDDEIQEIARSRKEPDRRPPDFR
ncbi:MULTISPECIES: plasmid stabilization protein [unclassified Mesorhizobium]|uniref:plasmid stabilization protein n=1 Tax=unclassified Mesorhizobium TaxID=325217 RepID=UPI000FDAC36A|nr:MULTISPECIES: plasmid stabilization protein [unclassified Mesorhizobium]TGQ30638.1 plasmid stabilization protein [Mesorhizobium sp. M00.F.Ca.ET.216.01.1.1]TIS89529.1 MAG: plasmid stabilization protein [Mesorhizobium sp.]TJW10478.1 MAG: plasmid stabilization protein [Mesorhizobium sp.]TJW45534.1 MAG: plasmid stabilization protein [Mesorhizobium sp.]